MARTWTGRLRLIAAAALAVCALVVPAAPAAHADHLTPELAAQFTPQACGGVLIVDVSYMYFNSRDYGAGGEYWALDGPVSDELKIFDLGSGRYCAIERNSGSFTTIAGLSPGGSGTVPAGVTGVFGGAYRMMPFEAKFAPTAPVRGFMGIFDLQCKPDRTCPGRGYVDWSDWFFEGGADYDYALYANRYDSYGYGSYYEIYDGAADQVYTNGDIKSPAAR